MMKWFSGLVAKRREQAENERKRKGPVYVYKPYENAMSYRVEFREELSYVYPGWSKSVLFKIEGDKIYSAADGELRYIIIGKDIFEPAGEQRRYRIAGGAVYNASGREILYELRDSITVQGTL